MIGVHSRHLESSGSPKARAIDSCARTCADALSMTLPDMRAPRDDEKRTCNDIIALCSWKRLSRHLHVSRLKSISVSTSKSLLDQSIASRKSAVWSNAHATRSQLPPSFCLWRPLCLRPGHIDQLLGTVVSLRLVETSTVVHDNHKRESIRRLAQWQSPFVHAKGEAHNDASTNFSI